MADIITWLTEPLGYAFMVRGLTAAVIVGVVCSVLGTYIVLRGMAFLGDALAHAILPGVAMGYLWGGGSQFWVSMGALVAGIFTTFAVGTISKSGLKEDTAIGVMFAGMFALGIAMISSVRSYTVDLTHFLFGNVLGVSNSDLWLIGIFGGLVLLTILVFYKEFMVISFDPLLATTMRLPTTFLHYLLLLLIAVTIVLSLQAVGIALMSAMLVTPAATAYLLTRRLPIMMVISATIGASSGVLGLYLSFYMNIASGPAIVLVCTAAFVLVFLFSPSQGLVWRLVSNNS
ncbi:metal ABC transporter permease [Anaerolineales bacterium HSG6]|nr:metal ABC transporter permease [Anaerolineales bacterium HSG6]MDM8529929.1 metal ABC transporter permease [Anaerolineales bacterium HSG25]